MTPPLVSGPDVLEVAPLLDDILADWRGQLGTDTTAYRNHCYRVVNFCRAHSGAGLATIEKAQIAAAFHDLGIWTDHTLDYLAPSRRLAEHYLAATGREAWAVEVGRMIDQHHRIRPLRSGSDSLVEAFRRADWTDVSRGAIRFGLPRAFVGTVLARFPNAGFHRKLIALAGRRAVSHPLRPLPMFRF